jgi:hypothetical protein
MKGKCPRRAPPTTHRCGRKARTGSHQLPRNVPLLRGARPCHARHWRLWLAFKVGVLLYFGGRLVYLPLYAFGIYLVRSIAWNVAAAGIFLLLGSVLLR